MRRTPLDLALVAMEAASRGNFVFRKTQSSAIDRVENSPEEDLGLDLEDIERLVWRDRNKAEAELVAASAWAWATAADARGRATTDSAWMEMAEGLALAQTIVEP